MENAAISRRAALALAAAVPALSCGCAADGTSQSAPAATSGSSGTVVIADSETAAVESPAAETQGQTTAEALLASMSLEQKAAQLFVCTPEQLTGVGVATQAGATTAKALQKIPVGGLVYFAQNITGAQQLRDMLANTRALCLEAGAGVAPFLAVDEEGGTLVARVAKSGYFDVPVFPNMAEVGATGDPAQAAEVGSGIGGYLADIGFNVDFAPVADVLTNPDNTAIGARSFGSDPELVAEMVAAEVEAMAATGTIPCAKHFPGHGDTAGDSHTGAVCSERTREQIEGCEYLPFSAAIEAGAPMVMMGHIETPELAGDGLPASLSRVMMTDELRGALGFGGLIIADSMSMGAITESYGPAEAAVMFLQGGGDLILMPESLQDAYDGVLTAVEAGELTEERIDESVLRILEAKERAGILA